MKPLWALAFSLLALVSASAGLAQEELLADRVVAVVDEDPILSSDLDRVIGLGLVEPFEGEEPEALRRRVLDLVIEERLRFHEIDRFGFTELSPPDVEAAFEQIRSRFGSDEEFEGAVAEYGMSDEDIRQLAARQLMVLTYVDERLGARIFVGGDDIRRYYDETLVPRLRGEGLEIPDYSAVREQIRGVLREQRLNEEIERWTEELRLEADIEDYLSSTGGVEASVELGSDGG